MSPAALAAPIPPLATSAPLQEATPCSSFRGRGACELPPPPGRPSPKWNGGRPLVGGWAAAAVVAALPAAALSVGVLVAARRMATPDAAAACVLALAALSAAGRVLDQRTNSDDPTAAHAGSGRGSGGGDKAASPAVRALGLALVITLALAACLFWKPWDASFGGAVGPVPSV